EIANARPYSVEFLIPRLLGPNDEALLGMAADRLDWLRVGLVEGGAEGAQAPLDARASRANGRLEGRTRERKLPCRREGAEHRRRNHAAVRLRERFHVEGDDALRRKLGRQRYDRRVSHAVARRLLLRHRERAMRGRD